MRNLGARLILQGALRSALPVNFETDSQVANMYQKILLPLDGSSFSREALPLAIRAARDTGAELRLLHVVESLVGGLSLDLGTNAQERFLELARRITAETGVRTTAEFMRGRAVPMILEYAEDNGVDLIVVATHGWSGIQRAWLGSTTDSLIRAADTPVLAIRPHSDTDSAAIAQPETSVEPPATELLAGPVARRPLIPLDGSELAESAIEPLINLVGTDAHYTLLRVSQIPIAPSPVSGSWAPETWQEQIPAMEREAQAYLDKVRDRLAGRVGSIETAVLTELGIAHTILAYAEDNGNDMIAISTRGHGGLRRLAIGSVADKVLRGANVPVFLKGPGARD